MSPGGGLGHLHRTTLHRLVMSDVADILVVLDRDRHCRDR